MKIPVPYLDDYLIVGDSIRIEKDKDVVLHIDVWGVDTESHSLIGRVDIGDGGTDIQGEGYVLRDGVVLA